MVYVYHLRSLDSHELVAGGGVLFLAAAVLWYIQRSIDRMVMVALSQSNYAHDDAFAALFDRSPVAYLIIDSRGKIVESNAAAIKLLQTEVDVILQKNIFSFITPNTDIDPSILQGKVRAGVTLCDIEVPLTTVKEESIWVMLSTFAYRSSGQRLLVLVDVTEQKHVDTAKSEFVALATHQLRTPIAAIRWNVELLQKSLVTSATESQTRYLTKIERNVLRMIALINDFLSVSKLEMGTYATNEETVDVSDLFSSVIDEFSGKITEKSIVLNRSELPAHVVIKTDRRLLQIIVSNLVSNAVKYLPFEGKLGLSYQLTDQKLTIVVVDNGIGIPEGELDKLFTKFYRASNAQSHQTEGTGLGLYIVQQSVDLLGGEITVSAKENQGARFVVTLPTRVVSVGVIS